MLQYHYYKIISIHNRRFIFNFVLYNILYLIFPGFPFDNCSALKHITCTYTLRPLFSKHCRALVEAAYYRKHLQLDEMC